MKLYLEGVGLRGPGFPHWIAGREILAGRVAYRPDELIPAADEILPVGERRRATETVKLAITVCSEATRNAAVSPENTPSVFASSGGDGATIVAIFESLVAVPREVSPTRFHNSVHNAPAGYWGIATHSREASTSVCAYDFSFTAGFIEAASQVLTEHRPILLAAYDLPYPPALHAIRQISAEFAVALVLSPHPTARSLASLSFALIRDERPATGAPGPEFETLRSGNPAARSLPLLAAVARAAASEVALQHVAGNMLIVEVMPLGGAYT